MPIPEEVPILTGGVLAHEGLVRWWIALPVCVLGVLSGDAVLYWAGYHWGERVLEWRVVRRVLTVAREQRLKAAYQHHGTKIVFAARHVMGLRAAAFLTAGIVRVPFGRFLLVDAAAALIGVPLAFGLAFLFTAQLEQIMRGVHEVEWWALLGIGAACAVWITWAAIRRTRRDVEREEATPAPRRML